MNVHSTLGALRRFWWLVLAFTVGGAVVAGLPQPETTADSVTRWTASHTILVSNSSGTGSIYNDALSFNQIQLFTTTGVVPTRVADELDFNGAPAALSAQIAVAAEQQTGALRITTTQGTAERAVEVADTFAEELITYLAERQDELRQDRLTSTLSRLTDLEAEVAEAEVAVRADENDEIARAQLAALSRRYGVVFEQYNVLQTDEGGQLVLTTLEQAQPIAITERGLSAPRSRVTRGLLGAIVGATLGLGLAVLLSRTDRRIRSRQQAEDLMGMDAHAMIPAVEGHHAGDLAVVPDRHDPLSDSYRALRSLISFIDSGSQRSDDRGLVTLVVSAGPGDGKTSITANLSSAFVEAGSQTVAVNSDFRRPTLSRRLAVPGPGPVGLNLAEIEHAPLELILAPVGDVGLSVFDLSAMREYNPGELARLTARVLPRLTAAYDHVVIDSSPVGGTAEVLEFVPLADTIIMTVTLGHTHINSARRAIEMIRALSTGNILLAIIGGDADDSNYYYYYSSSTPKEPKGRLARLTSRKSKRSTPNMAARVGQPVVYPSDVDLLAPLLVADDPPEADTGFDPPDVAQPDGGWPRRSPDSNGDNTGS